MTLALTTMLQLCLFIDGSVPLPELFDILNAEVDPSILASTPSLERMPPLDWQRPFVETTTSRSPAISKSQTEVVEFMEEDESMGEVMIMWFGPSAIDYRTNVALKILASYLAHSPTSPLQKEFIEIPKPYATSIDFYSEDRVKKNECLCIVSDVPVKHLETIGEMVKGKMRTISEKEGIDMERMGLVLRRDRRKLLNYMETSVSSVLSDAIIGGELCGTERWRPTVIDFLYGDLSGKDLPTAFDDLKDYTILEGWKAEDWISLLQR